VSYDYRTARDLIFGIVRHEGSDRIKEITPTRATASERALLLALVEFAPNIEPSIATLAKMTAMDARSIRRLIGACKSKGLLELRPGLGQLATNRYTLLDPGHTAPPDIRSPDKFDTYPGQIRHLPRTVCPPKQTKKQTKDHEPFRLVGSAPTYAAPGKATKPKRGATAGTPSADQQVIDCYFEAFKAQHGREPTFDGADGTAVKRLLAKLKGDGAEACRRVRNAFTTFRAGSVTIRDIASKPDAFASAEIPKGVGVQRGPGDAEVVARMRAESRK
jgi:hypothetical protein